MRDSTRRRAANANQLHRNSWENCVVTSGDRDQFGLPQTIRYSLTRELAGQSFGFTKIRTAKIELFDLMGFHRDTGEELTPVSKEIVELWKEQQARKTAKPVDPDIYPPFDPDGRAQIWYYHSTDGEYEFFDHPGYEPQTGEALIIITRDVLDQWRTWKKQNAEQKCYVLTRDGKVTYGEHPGIDPATGRECRPVKPEIVERLQEYAAGKRAQPITDPNPTFFDERSGEPIVWYYRSKDNKIQIFNLMGFDSETGDELIPITKEVVEQWKIQSKKQPPRVPNLVDPDKYVFFDPLSGNPRGWYWQGSDGSYKFYDGPGFQAQTGDPLKIATRDVVTQWKDKQTNPMTPKKAPNSVQIGKDTVFFDPVTGRPLLWYWRRDEGEYEFFDGPGFDPQNGQPLQSFTREALSQYQSEIAEKDKELQSAQEAKSKADAAKKKEDAERQLNEQKKEELDKKLRAEAAQRRTEAAQRCDHLAANPNDAQRVGQGVSYVELRPLADQAVDACEAAIQQNPNELRFQYQLARALELAGDGAAHVRNRQRAMGIEQVLVAKGYAAAFDNLASMYRDRNDLGTAVPLFRKGIDLGNSDSMVSLADLLDDQRVVPQSPDETALALYKRAADLGNQNGVRGYQALIAKAQETQQQQLQQLQNRRLMLQFLGGVLRNIPNR